MFSAASNKALDMRRAAATSVILLRGGFFIITRSKCVQINTYFSHAYKNERIKVEYAKINDLQANECIQLFVIY